MMGMVGKTADAHKTLRSVDFDHSPEIKNRFKRGEVNIIMAEHLGLMEILRANLEIALIDLQRREIINLSIHLLTRR